MFARHLFYLHNSLFVPNWCGFRIDRFIHQVNQLAYRMRELIAGHETSISLVAEILERRQVIQTHEDDTSELFDGLVWSLPDDESISIALEFYASFLHGFMAIRDIRIEEDPDTLERLLLTFDNWVNNHNNQFFSFTTIVASQPETQQQATTADEIAQRVTRVADIARDNESMALEAQEASEKLGQITTDLESLVQRFKI